VPAAIARGSPTRPYADLLWLETGKPDLDEAREFAEADPQGVPRQDARLQLLASFNWKRRLDDATIAKFQRELGAMGFKFQFVTLSGFHSLNHAMFTLAREYKSAGMSAYARLQEQEFARSRKATRPSSTRSSSAPHTSTR
jgi:isocitrate lyase